MNAVHAAVIQHLRAAMAKRSGKLARDFIDMTDDECVRQMFSNFRGKGEAARGLRLTRYGLDIMGETFRCIDIKFREPKTFCAADLIYLERNTRLPYFCSPERLVLFELVLGMKLRFHDGDIATVREIEGA